MQNNILAHFVGNNDGSFPSYMKKCQSWNKLFWQDIILLCVGSIFVAAILTLHLKGNMFDFGIRFIFVTLGATTLCWFLFGKEFYSTKPDMTSYYQYKDALRGIAYRLGKRQCEIETVDFDALCTEVKAKMLEYRELSALFLRNAHSECGSFGDAIRAYNYYEDLYADAEQFGLQGNLPKPETYTSFAYSA